MYLFVAKKKKRDLGLWVEAEQLLSDVCSYYSEDQWSHLFIKAYSLLAECQNKLQMEDKYPLDVIYAYKIAMLWYRIMKQIMIRLLSK